MRSLTFLLIFSLIAIFTNAQTTHELVKLAQAEIKKGNYKEAIKLYDKAIEKDGKNSELYVERGIANCDYGKFEDGKYDFLYAIKLKPSNALAHLSLGRFYMSGGEYEQAIPSFTKALNYATTDSVKERSHKLRGDVYWMKGDYANAETDYKKVLTYVKDEPEALMNLGAMLSVSGKQMEALGYFKRLYALQPDTLNVIMNVGFGYLMLENYDSAEYYFNRVLSKDPEHALALSNTSYILYKKNKLDEALKMVNRSIKNNKANSYAYKNRALIYIALDKHSKACADLESALNYNFTAMYGPEVEELFDTHCRK